MKKCIHTVFEKKKQYNFEIKIIVYHYHAYIDGNPRLNFVFHIQCILYTLTWAFVCYFTCIFFYNSRPRFT